MTLLEWLTKGEAPACAVKNPKKGGIPSTVAYLICLCGIPRLHNNAPVVGCYRGGFVSFARVDTGAITRPLPTHPSSSYPGE